MAARLALVPTQGFDADDASDDAGHGPEREAAPTVMGLGPGAGGPGHEQQALGDALVGRVVGGRYRLEALIAQGGMGRIYRATQLTLGRMVAVKILLPPSDPSAERLATQRFVFEAAAAARLHHPHSVTVLDYGTDPGGIAYLVMELLQGRTLGQLLRHEGRLEVYRALTIAKQTAAALCAAHAQNIVHRDLKPGNLFLAQGPHVDRDHGGTDFIKVVDYGLAKPVAEHHESLTVTGRFMGSPGYMAPEQIRGENTDHRCDIYALGAILFEMLTGAPAYLRANVYETMVAQVHEPLPPLTLRAGGHGAPRAPSYAAALEALVRRAMAKAPGERFASMAELYDALSALLTGPGPYQGVARPQVLPHRVATARGDTWVEATLGRALGRAHVYSAPPPPAHGGAAVRRPRRAAGDLKAQAPGPRAGVVWRKVRHGLAAARLRWGLVLLALSILGVVGKLCGPYLWARAAGVRAAFAPVVVHLDSAPRGAAVWHQGRQLCRETPCVVHLRRPLFKRHVSLRFTRPPLDEFVATRRLCGPSLQVHAVLDGGAEHGQQRLDQDEPHDGHLDAHGLL